MKEDKTFKVWISKYALTLGIFEETVSQSKDQPTLVSVVGVTYPTNYHDGSWHMTRELAVRRAEKIRTNKLISLKKQIAHIEAIKF